MSMIMPKLLAASALFMMSITSAPAVAQAQNDPVYECFVGCIASRPNSFDWCAVECNRRFGGEQTGGGGPDRTTNPGPGRQCFGSFNQCNPTQ